MQTLRDTFQLCPGYVTHTERTGQPFVIVGKLGPDEVDEAEVGPMYRIQFADGETVDAFEDEIFRDD